MSEHVAFLIEKTGTHVDCMLNPESVTIGRQAGVKPKRSIGGFINSSGMSDDPFLYAGGGRTEIRLQLLFDLLASSHTGKSGVKQDDDVRTLTGPLMELVENTEEIEGGGYKRPPYVRFMWGKWNIPGLIVEMAERFENFTPNGEPRRSWVSMRFLRCMDGYTGRSLDETQGPGVRLPPGFLESRPDLYGKAKKSIPSGAMNSYEVKGERGLDLIAHNVGLVPQDWREIALLNNISNPLSLEGMLNYTSRYSLSYYGTGYQQYFWRPPCYGAYGAYRYRGGMRGGYASQHRLGQEDASRAGSQGRRLFRKLFRGRKMTLGRRLSEAESSELASLSNLNENRPDLREKTKIPSELFENYEIRGERGLDLVAYNVGLLPQDWREIALINNIAHPLKLKGVLKILKKEEAGEETEESTEP